MRRHHVREHERRGSRVSDYMRGKGSGGSTGSSEFSRHFARGGKSTELSSEERGKLPMEAFAIPSDRAYPVPTVEQLMKLGWSKERAEIGSKRHALNALQRSSHYATDYEKQRVKSLVETRQPEIFSEWKKGHIRDPIVIVKKPNGQTLTRQYNDLDSAELYANRQEEKGYDVQVKPTFGEKAGAALKSIGSSIGHGLQSLRDGKDASND